MGGPILHRCAALLCGLAALLGAFAGVAPAAKLVGGRRQAAIDHAFFVHGAHRGQAIVSTRVSTVMPAWSVVRSVLPRRAGRPSGRVVPRLRSAYYHLVAGTERPGRPPARALTDLRHRFTVEVRYSGSGSEAIAYQQPYSGVCAGLGGFTDQQSVTVRPMSWTVRYEIAPDDLLSAVRGRQGTVLVPQVSLLRTGSSVTAIERLQRSVVDLSCAGKTTRWSCTETDRLARDGGLLSFPSGEGLRIGVPTTSTGKGQCAAVDYTLGPSLWDSGATTALVKSLGIDGGRLAPDPYAPIPVSWPGSASGLTDGFLASPCQGDPACTDSFAWRGTVTLEPAAGG